MTHDDEHDGVRDLLAALRAEYREDSRDGVLPGGDLPGGDLPPEHLADCDAATQRAAGWMQEAWALESATEAGQRLGVPHALARAARDRRTGNTGPRVRRAASVALLAAAAALAAVLVWRGPARPPAAPDDTPIASVAPSPVEPAPPSLPARRDFAPGSFRSRDDGVELVTGSVRLVLLRRDD